jgi:hypothetical protein
MLSRQSTSRDKEKKLNWFLCFLLQVSSISI